MTIPLTFLTRYAVPLIIAALYMGDVDIPQQFEIFDKTQRLADEALSKARHEGEGENGGYENYDYIIIGGGSAGALLANRLTESGEDTVLLLEAGGDPNPIMEVPYAQRFYWSPNSMDWGYSTVKQNRSCGNKGGICTWPRGKALGGSSSVNGLVYNRCKPRDYDMWAEFTGDESWSWNNVKELYNSFEDYHGFYEETAGDNHGKGGEMYVGKIDYIPGVEVMEEALREKGIPLGDLNAGEQNTYGFSKVDYNIKQGLRWGTYQAFLEPILSRTNLKIYRYAYAVKVDTVDIGGLNNRAMGVTYMRHGVLHRAGVVKEVILSAGVVESPKLLMLSGFGPQGDLNALGIPVIKDLPVGKYLQEHPGLEVIGSSGGFRVNSTFGKDLNTTENVLQFIQNGTGPLNGFRYENGFGSQIVTGYLNSKTNDDRTLPDVLLYVQERFLQLENGTGIERFNFAIELLRSKGMGTIKLASGNPEDKPLIDPNFFADEEDLEKMVDGMGGPL